MTLRLADHKARSGQVVIVALLAAAALVVARPALAGPPLLCHPFDIGTARSLPIGNGGWQEIDRTYDTSHLVADTLAILTPDAPVTVRMETIRRATVYAATKRSLADALMAALQERAQHPDPKSAALAVFDFGYLVETYREGLWAFSSKALPPVDAIDGYQLVLKAHAMQSDAQIQEAANLILSGLPKKTAAK
jgi:hypothetical protein